MRAAHLLLAGLALVLIASAVWFMNREGALAELEGSGLDRQGPIEVVQSSSSTDLSEAQKNTSLEAASITSKRTDVEADEVPVSAATAKPTRGISGKVVDEFGKPVARARVFVASPSAFGGLAIDRIAEARGDFAQVEQTTTDDKGRFQMATGHRGDLRLAVRAPGFAPLRVKREVQGQDMVEVEDLVLERSVLLSGHVVDEAGNGIAGVAIDALEASSGGGFSVSFFGSSKNPLAKSGPGGAFEVNELAAGPYELRFSHDEHPSLSASGNVDRPGQAQSGLRFVMADGHAIAGRVNGLEPGQAPKLLVRARLAGEGGFDLDGDLSDMRMASLAPDGSFELRGLREGEYQLHAVESDSGFAMFAPGKSAMTRARTGDRGVQIQLREPTGLTMRVLDAKTGAPITTYSVEAGLHWMQPLKNSEGEESETHPEGVATFDEVPMDQGDTKTNLKIKAEGYQTLDLPDIALEPGVMKNLGDLRMSSVSMITVRVVDHTTGKPIEGARVSLSEVREALGPGARSISMAFDEDSSGVEFSGERDSNSARTDKEGMAEIPSLSGKLCELIVKHRSYAEYKGQPVKLPDSGGRELEARLLQGGSVTVLVLSSDGQPKQGVRVARSRVGDTGPMIFGGGDDSSRKSNSKGLAEFRHLPVGTHNFRIEEGPGGAFSMAGGEQVVIAGFNSGKKAEGVDVEVSEGSDSEITLRDRAEGEVSGKVTEGGKPLVGADLSFEEDSGGGAGPRGMPMMMSGFGGGQSTRTNSQGEFSQKGLKVGRYKVRIEHKTRAMAETYELTVLEGKNSKSFELSISIIEGRVLDSEGEPVVGATVTPKRFVESGSGSRERRMVRAMMVTDTGGGAMSITSGDSPAITAKTDEDGKYVLRGVEHDVKLVVEVTSPVHQKAESEPVTVGENQTRRGVDVDVFEAGQLQVIVQDKAGNPVSFCLAEIEFAEDIEDRPETQNEFVGEGGQATVTSLRPGRWRASARSVGMMGPGSDEDERKALPVEVVVAAGETAVVTLTLE